MELDGTMGGEKEEDTETRGRSLSGRRLLRRGRSIVGFAGEFLHALGRGLSFNVGRRLTIRF